MLRVIGLLMMLDGVLAVSAAAGVADTFVYRNWRDQALIVAGVLAGLASGASGYLLTAGRKAARLAAGSLAFSLAVAAAGTTRFDWPALAARALLTTAALIPLWRGRHR
jgi:hypothetical protein